jgi:hypothetical protein
MIMQFPGTDPRPADAGKVAPPEAPARKAGPAHKLATQDVVRRMMIIATKGAFELRAGRRGSAYFERFDALHREHTENLSSYPESGATDFRFLLRRARAAFEKFGETVRYEFVEGVQPNTCEDTFDEALECVKQSAIIAAASLGSIELALKHA